jgi:hypothetical protein
MSFLSRKPARPDSRGGGAGRDDEYDSYDDYAPDGYANEDDAWSPGEYFSPEGIKGKWAGERPEGRAGGRGQRDDSRRDNGADYDSFADGFDSGEYGHYGQAPDSSRTGYDADEYATGVYDLPEGADDDRPERSRRRRRDREDSGERTGIFRLRRDRGEDIWPDDGISDEDYWASVAADRPLNGADVPADNHSGARPPAAPAPAPAPATAAPAAARPGMDGRPSDDARFTSDQRGGPGRLGPAPGLSGDYQPGAAPGGSNGTAGASGGFGQPGSGLPGSGQPGSGRTGSGPMQPARSGTGPTPVRVGTGPTPTVGVTASRPPTAPPNGMRPGQAQPSRGSGGFPQAAPARPSFQPNGFQPGSGPASSRQPEPGDRTERIERVNASGYPDPRPGNRSQPASTPSFSNGTSASGNFSASGGFGGPGASSGAPATAGRSRADSAGRTDNSRADAGRGDAGRGDAGRGDSGAWRTVDRRDADRRDSRDNGRDAGGSWPPPGRNGAPARPALDDDPLTSQAYSQAALTDTDGRSYRVAARRSQSQAKLTEQAENFINGQYQRGGQHRGGTDDYPTASFQPADQRSGEYRQHRGDGPAAPGRPFPAAQPPAGGRYPAGYGGQPGQPARGQAGPSQAPNPGQGYPGQPGRNGDRPGQAGNLPGHGLPTAPGNGAPSAGQPGGGLPTGPYEQQARQQQQPQRPQAQPRPAQPPAAATAPASVPLSAPIGNGASSGRHSMPGGLNPYDSDVTASYPYPGQSVPARPATGGQPQDAADDPYYRPAANGYPATGTAQGRNDQDRGDQRAPGYGGNHGNGYRSY